MAARLPSLPRRKKLHTIEDALEFNFDLANYILEDKVSRDKARLLIALLSNTVRMLNAKNIDSRLTEIEKMLENPDNLGGRPAVDKFQPVDVPSIQEVKEQITKQKGKDDNSKGSKKKKREIERTIRLNKTVYQYTVHKYSIDSEIIYCSVGKGNKFIYAHKKKKIIKKLIKHYKLSKKDERIFIFLGLTDERIIESNGSNS